MIIDDKSIDGESPQFGHMRHIEVVRGMEDHVGRKILIPETTDCVEGIEILFADFSTVRFINKKGKEKEVKRNYFMSKYLIT